MTRVTYAPLLLLLLFGLAACGDGPTIPNPDGDPVAIVVAPGGLLLPAAGATAQLRALGLTADGDTVEVAASFESSNPSAVSITAAGLATGGASVGSALITARSGGLTSAPMLALRATPAAGALLVTDDDVVGAVEAVDPAAPYAPGRESRVRLRGAAPTVGQMILATGASPIGGRVVRVSGGSGAVDVVFAMVPLSELFEQLSVNAQLPLVAPVLASSSQDAHGVRLSRSPTGGTRVTAPAGAHYQASALRTTTSATGRIEQEFDLGPFKCKAEVPAPITVPISLGTFSGDLNESLALDLAVEFLAVQRLVVQGTIRPTMTVTPRITAAFEGKVECKYKVREFPLPITGALSGVIGGQVPVGFGFELGGKTTIGQLGADVTLTSTVATQVGFDCTGACQWVHDMATTAPDVTVKPVVPDLGTSMRVELGAAAFGWAELQLGLTLWDDETTRLKLLSAKAGLEQKFELATADAQAADAAYASSYALKPAVEVKAAAEYAPLENLVQVSLTLFTWAPELPHISRSPRGTFAITPASVRAGDDTELGERATFTVTLTDTDYFGAYAVESVLLRWRRTVGETVVLESGRPGCSELTASTGQVSFTCETDFLTEHVGQQTFHAFVRTRIWGVPVQVPLEIGPDAKSVVTVNEGGAGRVTLEGSPHPGTAATLGFTGAGDAPGCQDSEPDDAVEADPPLSLSLSAQCSGNAVSTEGAALSGSFTAGLTYALDVAAGNLRSFTATGQSGGQAQGEGDGVGDLAAGRVVGSGSSRINFEFEVLDADAAVTLTGQLSGSIGTPAANVGAFASVRLRGPSGELYFAMAGREFPADATQPGTSVNRVLHLPPGIYDLEVETITSANTFPLEPHAAGSAQFSITMTISP